MKEDLRPCDPESVPWIDTREEFEGKTVEWWMCWTIGQLDKTLREMEHIGWKLLRVSRIDAENGTLFGYRAKFVSP